MTSWIDNVLTAARDKSIEDLVRGLDPDTRARMDALALAIAKDYEDEPEPKPSIWRLVRVAGEVLALVVVRDTFLVLTEREFASWLVESATEARLSVGEIVAMLSPALEVVSL